MEEFKNLLNIADTLLGEKGCIWDKKQSFDSIKKYFIEEAEELAEAIDKKDDENILEEAGDLLYMIIFLSKIAEKSKKFTLKDVLKNISKKMIHRHPHVFSDEIAETEEDAINFWDEAKKIEKQSPNIFKN